ncbi:MAG: bactofilin family protein [Flavobacteriaceae bacterium]
MFSDQKKKIKTTTSSSGQQNRIVQGTKIVGTIVSEAGLRIDGEVEGDVTTSGKVVLGETGVLNGTLSCSNADFEGVFKGKLNVKNMLTLRSTSQVEGDVFINKLTVEPGALFNATCSMGAGVKTLNANSVEEKTA